jgi:hypothetical protein
VKRRESLRILAAALGGAAVGRAFAAGVGDRVEWRDVTLLTAARFPRRR